jgi:hypothetical protein
MRRALTAVVAALALVTPPAVATAAGSAAPAGAAPACDPLTTKPHYTKTVPTSKQVLGYQFGKRKATDQDINNYVHAVDHASDRVVSGVFATSWQGRPLPYALVGSPQTIDRLPAISTDLQALRDPATPQSEADAIVARTPTVLWITANVHGNEPSGGDAVLKLLYELADRDDCVSQAILGNALVGLIPTQNPDGRANDLRTNGYTFDMNRDWFARTQPETVGKLNLLWQYPPQLYVDEHEMGGTNYFFPPDSDPIYAETPDRAYDQIENLYGAANAAAFTAKGWSFETYQSGYDLFYQGYGDTVPTTEFGAAGMTYEQGGEAKYRDRVEHHYTSALVSVYTGATHRATILRQWRATFVEAQAEGRRCELEPNKVFNPGSTLLMQVPDKPVCGYFLRDQGRESQLIVNRLQLAHVQVQRLTAPLVVPDYTAYGEAPQRTTLPAGTYWVTMAQPQKHWVQAMLNEDTYVPFPYFYDVSGWSNPLLAGVAGGYTGRHLDASLETVPPVGAPAPPALPSPLPRVGILDDRPIPSYEYQTTGWLRWRLAQDWKVPYTVLTPEQMTPARLRKLDVLLVPNVDVRPTYKRLGHDGRTALQDWVRAGGRYVGWQGGALEASALHLSTVGFADPAAASPGALMRVDAPHPNTYVLWDSYDDQQMSAGSAQVIAAFPSRTFVSGYAEQTDTLAGSPVEAVDRVGAGSVTVFSVEPNFRGFTDSSAQLLFDAMLATPTASLTAPAPLTRPAARAPVAGVAALDLGHTAAQHIARESVGRP